MIMTVIVEDGEQNACVVLGGVQLAAHEAQREMVDGNTAANRQ